MRKGLTLIELVIVVALIAILIALLLPAVQRARGAAARIECADHLRQVGTACHNYIDANKALPVGMRYKQGKDLYPFMSWLTQLLPYIEQGALWRASSQAYGVTNNPFQNPPHTPLATAIALYVCPSDGRIQQPELAQQDKFLVAFTSYLGVSGQNLYSHDGVLFVDSSVRIADITDGTSQTLLAGERPPSADYQFGWWYAGVGQLLTGSGDAVLGVREQNWLPLQKADCPYGTYSYAPGSINNQCDLFHYWSLHDGGANFLFADGSIHFIAYSGAPVLPVLASRQGNDVAPWID